VTSRSTQRVIREHQWHQTANRVGFAPSAIGILRTLHILGGHCYCYTPTPPTEKLVLEYCTDLLPLSGGPSINAHAL
jgi:hypothetical protein